MITFLAFILIVLVICFLYLIWRDQQKGAAERYTQLGAVDRRGAAEVLQTVRRQTAVDNFIAGEIANHFFGIDPRPHYEEALLEIIADPDPLAPFVVDRIYNYDIGLQMGLLDAARMAIRREIPRAAAQFADPQNVHDSNVTVHDRQVYNRLRQKEDPRRSLDSLREFARTYQFEVGAEENARRKAAILRTIDLMDRGTEKVDSLGDESEYNILTRVWSRINSPENADRAAIMRGNLMHALSECEEDGVPVCVTGRKARVLSALNFDSDATIGKPAMTTQMIRQAALYRGSTIVKDYLKTIPESAAKKYNDGIEDEEVTRIVEEIHALIDRQLRAEFAGQQIDLENLIKDVQAAV